MNFFVLAILLFTAPTFAMVPLVSQTIADSPRTLPQGRFMISYHRELMPIGSEFGTSGGKKPFSDKFNRTLTWQNIAEADTVRVDQLKGLLLSKGIDPVSDAANYTGAITGKIDVTVPVIGYGITDKIGLYVAIPIVHFQARSTLQYRSTESARVFIQALSDSGQQSVADEFSLTLNKGVKERLRDAGYDYEESVDKNMLGDIQVQVPYVFDDTFAIYSSAILPTGKSESPSDLFGVASGEQRFGLGTRGVKKFLEFNRFAFTGVAGVKVLFPRSQPMRIPRYSGDVLSTDIDQETQINWAFGENLAVDGHYQISRSFGAQAGLQHQMRLAESVNGGKFSTERYALLEPDRKQRLESFFLNLEYNSIHAFLDGDFLFPMQIVAGLAVPLSGQQTVADSSGMVQVSLFF